MTTTDETTDEAPDQDEATPVTETQDGEPSSPRVLEAADYLADEFPGTAATLRGHPQNEEAKPGPPKRTRTRRRGGDSSEPRGLREYARKVALSNEELRAENTELRRENRRLKLSAVLTEMGVPAAFHAPAHARDLDPTREAVTELMEQLRDEVRSAERNLRVYDEEQPAAALPGLPYSREQIAAAVAAALANGLGSQPEDDEDGDEW